MGSSGGNSIVNNPSQIWGGDSSVFNSPDQIWGGENSFVRHPGQTWDAFHPKKPDTPTDSIPDAGEAEASARQQSIFEQNQRIRKRMASQTLFTGGRGLTDSPSTASVVLLGN